jgi:lipoprotein-anchoring transpeptidase ErfK/SrfK
MTRVALTVLGLLVSCTLAVSAPKPKVPSRDDVNAAQAAEPPLKGIGPATLKAQVLLDRLRFSPGVIDGLNGENYRHALAAFEKASGFKDDGRIDPEVFAKLTEASPDPALIEYTITADDVKGPFLKIPKRMEDQADLEKLAYRSAKELLAEKFHMDEDLMVALNPSVAFDEAGVRIVVANVHAGETAPDKTEKAAKLEVDKKAHALRALRADGSLLAVYPASIGSTEKPAPSGTHTVRAVAARPTYTYNPEFKFKSVKAKEKFTIKAGPNNPVGSTWIDLSVDTFGIHGTPEPSQVGKAASHGCVRLTNWDVEELSRMVQKDLPVVFQE